VHLHPQGGEKIFFTRNLPGKWTQGHKVHPPSQSKSQFLGHFLLSVLDFEVYLDRPLSVSTKKGRQLF